MNQQPLDQLVAEAYQTFSQPTDCSDKAISIRQIAHQHPRYSALDIARAFGRYEFVRIPASANIDRSTCHLLCIQVGKDLLFFNPLDIVNLVPALVTTQVE